jgi:protein ImuA
MQETKPDIIARLRREILPLHALKAVLNTNEINIKLGVLKTAFYNGTFPVGAIHEFIYSEQSDAAVTGGFIAGILSSLMQSGGASVWISSSGTIFPPALRYFGIDPDKIIFIELQKDQEILWAMEEALKCDGLAAVIGDISELSFTASRRLQLAVEESRVTGFLLRSNPRSLATTSCVTRWKITSLASEPAGAMPGIGFPRWNVELLKVKNGKPGNWQIEFVAGHFRHISGITVIHQQQKKKTG